MADPLAVKPGDLLATRSQAGFAGLVIRLGAAMRDQPNLSNHVVIVTHYDAAGTLWGAEGRPGGFGWVDCTKYMNSRWTLTNVAQPKTDKQRKIVTDGARAMIGAEYEWGAIAHAAVSAFNLPDLWRLQWGKDGEVPGQVICSSAAAWLYAKAKLKHPEGEREVTPADWVELWVSEGWARRAKQ